MKLPDLVRAINKHQLSCSCEGRVVGRVCHQYLWLCERWVVTEVIIFFSSIGETFKLWLDGLLLFKPVFITFNVFSWIADNCKTCIYKTTFFTFFIIAPFVVLFYYCMPVLQELVSLFVIYYLWNVPNNILKLILYVFYLLQMTF